MAEAKVVVFVSYNQADGKSAAAEKLARALQDSGNNVLVVDANSKATITRSLLGKADMGGTTAEMILHQRRLNPDAYVMEKSPLSPSLALVPGNHDIDEID